jgi:hypothetical protein
MSRQLTADDARQSLTTHVAERGAELFARFGPQIGWKELQLILQDRAFVRYPVTIEFTAGPLQPGEFAWPEPCGASPEDGYRLCVHPMFMTDLAQVPLLVLYQLVAVNYGGFAGHEEAEVFAAAALGMDREEYYRTVCSLADQLGSGFDPGAAPALPAGPGMPMMPSGCGGGGCGCH